MEPRMPNSQIEMFDDLDSMTDSELRALILEEIAPHNSYIPDETRGGMIKMLRTYRSDAGLVKDGTTTVSH